MWAAWPDRRTPSPGLTDPDPAAEAPGPGRGHLLPGLVCPVPGRGGEAGASVGEGDLGGAVGHSVIAQLQVGPVEQISAGPLALVIVHIEALGRGSPGRALPEESVDRLVEVDLLRVGACGQDDEGRDELPGGKVGVGLLVILVRWGSRPRGVAICKGDGGSTSSSPSHGGGQG